MRLPISNFTGGFRHETGSRLPAPDDDGRSESSAALAETHQRYSQANWAFGSIILIYFFLLY